MHIYVLVLLCTRDCTYRKNFGRDVIAIKYTEVYLSLSPTNRRYMVSEIDTYPWYNEPNAVNAMMCCTRSIFNKRDHIIS